MKYCVVVLLLIALTGCSTTYGTIQSFTPEGNPCEARIVSVKSPWDSKRVEFAGVCGSSAQASSEVNVEAAALILDSASIIAKDLLAR